MRIKTWAFIFSLSVFMIISGQHFFGRVGLLISFILALGINAVVYFWPERQFINRFKCTPLEGQDSWGLLPLANKLCRKAGLPLPSFYLLDSETPTAFSIGRNWQNANIIISSGLLNQFTQDEIETVLAHELSHIKRLDIFAVGVSAIIANFLLTVGYTLDFIWPWRWFGRSPKHFIFYWLFVPLAWLVIRFATGPRTYIANDKLASQILGDPIRLARLLWKLYSYSRTKPLNVSIATSHLFIVNPLTGRGEHRLFDFHPTVKRRINNLIGYFPI